MTGRNACSLPFFVLFALGSTSLFAAGDYDTRYSALLLGRESLDLALIVIREEAGNEAESRARISGYLRDLGLSDLEYPSIDSTEALQSYGQQVIDRLDTDRQAAFIVGWYGKDAERPVNANLPPSPNIICTYAHLAEFHTGMCEDDPRAYYSALVIRALLERPPD